MTDEPQTGKLTPIRPPTDRVCDPEPQVSVVPAGKGAVILRSRARTGVRFVLVLTFAEAYQLGETLLAAAGGPAAGLPKEHHARPDGEEKTDA